MNKHKLMVVLSSGAVILSLLIHIIHRIWPMDMSGMSMGHHSTPGEVLLIFLMLPILFLGVLLVLYVKKHKLVPAFVTLTLTFSSISTVVGGGGMVEYHFSIFMVIAILSYYENVKLLLLMTGIFVIEHLAGFFVSFFTPIIFGTSSYSFSMLCLHAAYLLFTSGATAWQITSKKKYTKQLQQQNEQKQHIIYDMVKKLHETNGQVSQTVADLKESLEESQAASHHTTASMQELAAGADQQVIMAQKSSEFLDEMTQGVTKIAEASAAVSKASDQTANEAVQGKEKIQEAIQQIHTIDSSVQHAASVIHQLKERSAEINDIMSVISGIAAQTNLLALNAAIEAARAGEHGKGFVVVAAEVRKLAEQSNQSAEQVARLIQHIQQETSQAVAFIQSGTADVKNGILLANEAENVFNRIADASTYVHEQIQQTAASAQQIAAGSTQVLRAVSEMTAFANQSAASSSSISSASVRQLQSLQTIDQTAEFLSGLVEELGSVTEKLAKQA
ncbi:methyl-accepting chemotaxis protein [Priestia sp. 179-F W1.4 NHS]|uniref:methyl-accepting chemotaxis protein n=1 Tax=Priestia sp. 179-F W1.4 NHS TaxID=3374296 RepID=UPI003878F8C8